MQPSRTVEGVCGSEGFGEVEAEDLAGDGVVGPALFDERHEQGAGHFRGVEAERGAGVAVGVGLHGGGGGEHEDVFASGVRGGGAGGLGTGFYDADDGHGDGGADFRQGEGGGGVAGDHEQFSAAGDEVERGFNGVAGDGGLRFGAVGKAGGVAEVEEVGAGEFGKKGAQDGEAAEAGVEDTDRALSKAAG